MIDLNILKETIQKENNVKKIIEHKNIFNKKYVQPLYDQLKTATDKKEFGKKLNEIKNAVEQLVQSRIEQLENISDDIKINPDICLDANSISIGNKHLINSIIDDIASYLSKYNFSIVSEIGRAHV